MEKRRLLVIVLLAFFCMGVQSGLAQQTTVITPSQQEKDFGEGYWTPEKMKAAKPLPFYRGNGEAAKGFLDDKQSGPAASVAGGLPGDNREKPVVYEDISSSNDNLLNKQDKTGYAEDFGTKDIFDDSYVTSPSSSVLQLQFPYRAIGKLFMTLGTSNSSCSASVISANDIIVTAAHCCYDRASRRWFSNFRFVPAYRNGNAPYGNYGWTRARVLSAWISSGGRQNDVCLIRLNADVTARTGYLGRSWNYPSVQHHFAFGYPGNIGSGQYLIECAAESYANCGNSLVNAMGCSMTYGSSGGPWIRDFGRFGSLGGNFVNGVVSGYDGTCTGTFGKSFNAPRFTSSNIVPLCTAEGC